MPLTLTNQPSLDEVSGSFRKVVVDVAFDASYPDGGEALTLRQLGLSSAVKDVRIQAPQSGYHFRYDRTNQRLQAYKQGPVVLREDTGAFTAGAAYTLRQLPGYILAIRGTAGSTGAKRIIPTGETAVAGEVAINWTTGVCTWGDAAITRAIFMYIPRNVPGFTTDLLTIDEVVNVTTSQRVHLQIDQIGATIA